MFCHPEQIKFAHIKKKNGANNFGLFQVLSISLVRKSHQENIKHIIISVDLSIVHPDNGQFHESQLECCVVVWEANGSNILKRRVGSYHLLKIGSLSDVSSWESKS